MLEIVIKVTLASKVIYFLAALSSSRSLVVGLSVGLSVCLSVGWLVGRPL